MSKPLVYNWRASNTQAVALTQTLVGAGSLNLNGNMRVYTDPLFNGIQLPGVQRPVTITSTNNLAGVNFTIKGTLGGIVVSSTIAGPNNATVSTSPQLFETITSITTNGAAANVSAGTDTSGNTGWFKCNNEQSTFNMAIQVLVTGTVTYDFEVTLDDANFEELIGGAVNTFTPITALTAATTSQFAGFTIPINYCCINVHSGSTGSFTATLMQQGLR